LAKSTERDKISGVNIGLFVEKANEIIENVKTDNLIELDK
jgi:hypothetical protein